MELGVEIGQKIRSAIKSKLVELGAYVDEELPDYIMVMVANRKSHEQMNKDLGLFLGSNTNMFTSWLHGILDRLRSLTTPEMTQSKARKEKGETSKEGYKEDGRGVAKEGRRTERERGKDSRRDGGRDKGRSWRERDRSDLSNCTIQGEPLREQGRDAKDRGKDLRRDLKELVKVSPVLSIPAELGKENQVVATTTLDRSSPHALEHGALAQHLNPVPSESVIDLKPEPDDFIDDFDSVNKLQQMDRPVVTAVPVQTLSSPTLLSPSSMCMATGTARAVPSEGMKDSVSHFSKIPQTWKEDNQQCDMQMLGMSSVVRIGVVRGEAGVQRHWQAEVPDEEDEDIEDNSFVGGLHSSVQVAPKLERRPSLPPNKQANKNLLLRAINEAQQSIANTTRLQQARKRQLVTVVPRARSQEECNSKHCRMEDMDHRVGNVIIKRHDKATAEQHSTTKMAIREQGMRSTMNMGQLFEDHYEQNLYMAPSTQEGVSQFSDAIVGGKVRDTRSFILTQQQYQNQLQASTAVADAVPALVPVTGPVSTPVALQPLKTHSAEQASRTLPMIGEGEWNLKATRVVHGRDASSYQTVTPKFIVTLDGAMEQDTSSPDRDPPDVEMCFDDLELMEEDEQEEIGEDEGQLFVQASDGKLVRLPTLKPLAFALGGSDLPNSSSIPPKKEEMEYKQSTPRRDASYIPKCLPKKCGVEFYHPAKILEQNAVGRRAAERCRFWPGCANGDSCPFHHPSQQCRLFPNCKFGDRCLYIHPNCRFDGQCMKTNCPYTHASRRAYSMPTKPVVEQLRVQPMQCKFFPDCKKPDCTFYHPKPCRYGSCCKRSDCSFFHPEVSLPPREALRWVRSQQLSQ
uniref:zinc finger CCCH domain-containing protein 14 isoform X2 n=1 Tax=Myxine glutinosa TaxID=7769 RepID=UPI00358F5C5B